MARLYWMEPEAAERFTRAEEKRQKRIQRDKRLKPPKAKRKGKAYASNRFGDYLAKPPHEID